MDVKSHAKAGEMAELGVRWRRVYNIWHGRYPEVKTRIGIRLVHALC